MSNEIWAAIPGFGDHYEASSAGRIRVRDRVVMKPHSRTGNITPYFYKGRTLSLKFDSKGYASVHIGVDGTKTTLAVHRAVLLAFVGMPPDGHEGCHNNGDSTDNRVENLRWDTHFNNNQDRRKHGTYRLGESHPMAKITSAMALEIYQSNERGRALARRFGICETKVSAIRLGHIWASVTGGVPRPKLHKSGPDPRASSAKLGLA